MKKGPEIAEEVVTVDLKSIQTLKAPPIKLAFGDQGACVLMRGPLEAALVE